MSACLQRHSANHSITNEKNIFIDIYTHITMYTCKLQKTGYNN